MESLKPIENKLTEVFKGAPQLSQNTRKTLVGIWPWIALIFGVLQVVVAFGLIDLTRRATGLYDYADEFSRALTGRGVGPTGFDKTLIYFGVVLLLVDAALLLMAYPKLKARQKSGWDLLFLGSLINVGYAVLSLFMYRKGFGDFLGSLIGSTIGFWLLFQVRDMYSKTGSTPTASAPADKS